MNEGILHKK